MLLEGRKWNDKNIIQKKGKKGEKRKHRTDGTNSKVLSLNSNIFVIILLLN